MGKGGSAASTGRSDLACTLPNESVITKKSLRECIPAHCFQRSYAHSLGALAWDLAVVGFSIWMVHWANEALPSMLVPFAYALAIFFLSQRSFTLSVLPSHHPPNPRAHPNFPSTGGSSTGGIRA